MAQETLLNALSWSIREKNLKESGFEWFLKKNQLCIIDSLYYTPETNMMLY